MECVKVNKGGANKTINEERRFVGAVWENLIVYKKIPEYDLANHSRNNPVSSVKPLPNKPKRKGRVIPQDELVKIFNGAIEESKVEGIDLYGVYLTLYVSCGRNMEILSIEPYQVDLVNDEIIFPDTKTDTEKRIPIHPFVKPYLAKAKERAIKEKFRYIFSDKNGHILSRNKPTFIMIKICKKIGIPRTTVHDLRRTFASNPNLSRETKIKIGNWQCKKTFDNVYNNPLAEPLKQEYIKWDVNYLPKPQEGYLDKDTKKTQG